MDGVLDLPSGASGIDRNLARTIREPAEVVDVRRTWTSETGSQPHCVFCGSTEPGLAGVGAAAAAGTTPPTAKVSRYTSAAARPPKVDRPLGVRTVISEVAQGLEQLVGQFPRRRQIRARKNRFDRCVLVNPSKDITEAS